MPAPATNRTEARSNVRSVDLADGGRVRVWASWLDPLRASGLFDTLRASVAWQQRRLRIIGREIPEPRLTAWFGDPGAVYEYSGLRLSPHPWPEPLAALRGRLQADLGLELNAVLCNLYRDGNDSVGWHADNEPELGPEPVIASVSLGATRRFVLKHRRRKQLPPVAFELESGTLLVMDSTTQRHWIHALPKQRAVHDARINLTFRRVCR